MKEPAAMDAADRRAGIRFLQLFVLVLVIAAALVAAFTRTMYRVMLAPENQTIVQLLDGWARVYKPILIDDSNPEVIVFGASWARDAFDPIAARRLTGKSWFNHAVSGATPYETRRFVESSMDATSALAVVLNLDTFLRSAERILRKRGFDEALLDTDPSGEPTRFLAIERMVATTFSWTAIGNSHEVLQAIRQRRAGVEQARYLDSYERFAYAGHDEDIGRLRAALERPLTAAAGVAGSSTAGQPEPQGIVELDRAVGLLCRRDLDVHAYITPSMILSGDRGRGLAAALEALELLRKHQPGCRARLHFYNFNYPNAVTLDGIDRRGDSSDYFRPDGHPRPTIGLLIAARMFGTEFPEGTRQAIVEDFGTDLLASADAERRLRAQAAIMERLQTVVTNPK